MSNLQPWIVLSSVVNPDRTVTVIYSFGWDDRVTVTIQPTDNLAETIYAIGHQMAVEKGVV